MKIFITSGPDVKDINDKSQTVSAKPVIAS